MTARRIASAVSLVVGLMAASSASAQVGLTYEWTLERPDAFAPTGVYGDHVLPDGGFQISFTFANQYMDGSLWDTDSVDVDDIFEFWTVAPVNMSSMTLSADLLYGLTDFLTLEANMAFTQNQMETWMPGTSSGTYFFYETSQLGPEDLKIAGLFSLFDEGSYRAHINAGVSIPFGKMDSYDDTPFSGGQDVYLGYPMQIGSGTFDLLPGFTVQVQNEMASFGMQGKATIRIRRNSRDWAYGDRYMGTAWGAYRISDYISASGRIEVLTWGDVEGSDARLDPLFSPDADPVRMGGTRVDLPLGVNIYFPEGRIPGYRFSVEGAIPLYQDLNGPQLQHSWTVRLGIYKIF